ncbi:hypothetical protein CDAR_405461 [Caerostris darwini]|uniref:Uncharacterized protein n=1 Tax=Caerostris darwini TaxID=1538125 RepID=A0AAV4WHT1_9ARAC|nr:hypothetical protein CDAR_405461 [Caerostris darwini]
MKLVTKSTTLQTSYNFPAVQNSNLGAASDEALPVPSGTSSQEPWVGFVPSSPSTSYRMQLICTATRILTPGRNRNIIISATPDSVLEIELAPSKQSGISDCSSRRSN